MAQNSWKHITYDEWFIIKDTTQEQPQGRDTQGQVCGKELGVPMPTLAMPTSQHLNVFTIPMVSGYYGPPITYAPLIKLWAVGD